MSKKYQIPLRDHWEFFAHGNQHRSIFFSCQSWVNTSREINASNDFQTLFWLIAKKKEKKNEMIKLSLPSGPVILSESTLKMVDLASRN